MHVIIAGSWDAFGSGGRFQACMTVAGHAAGQPHTLPDCGATSLTALRRQHLDPTMISTVVISPSPGQPAPVTGWPGPWTPSFPAQPPRAGVSPCTSSSTATGRPCTWTRCA